MSNHAITLSSWRAPLQFKSFKPWWLHSSCQSPSTNQRVQSLNKLNKHFQSQNQQTQFSRYSFIFIVLARMIVLHWQSRVVSNKNSCHATRWTLNLINNPPYTRWEKLNTTSTQKAISIPSISIYKINTANTGRQHQRHGPCITTSHLLCK